MTATGAAAPDKDAGADTGAGTPVDALAHPCTEDSFANADAALADPGAVIGAARALDRTVGFLHARLAG